MARTARELSVWANGVRVGSWRWPARGSTEFEYDESWRLSRDARPISLSLPLTVEPLVHRGRTVEAYFDNLLPDSERIRRRMQERFHARSRNPFDLLLETGRDCVGALQLLGIDDEPERIKIIAGEPLTSAEIARDIAAVTSPPSLNVAPDAFRISIAGAQEKTAFLRHRDRWCRPAGATPSTHIFKLPLGLIGGMRVDMSGSVENEWLCARIAQEFGIPIAHCEIGEFDEQRVLIVERFDRVLHSSGKYWLRLMQEDFCQAKGLPNDRKYQADGGPGIVDLAGLLRGAVDAQRDIATLLRAQILFYLLAAPDGHAKNFSIRLLPRGHFQLTPLYDVLSAWPVAGPRANQVASKKLKLAMGLPGTRGWHYKIADVHRRHFERLGQRCGYRESALRLVDDMIAQTDDVLTKVQRRVPRGFPQRVLETILDGVRRHARALA